MTTIAALYVYADGPYASVPDCDVWDEARDARNYDGPHPVVAHPPCSRWCRLAGLVEARWGHKRGDDGGCFEHALSCVRRFGGVLEHPAYSDAWSRFDLPRPSRSGGWQRGICGGWSCHVEQGRYGHPAKKATWLYAYGVDLPELRWGSEPDNASKALVSWCGNRVSAGMEGRPRVGKRAASVTPPAFLDVLVAMARSAQPAEDAAE
jgi:hypothetical protein